MGHFVLYVDVSGQWRWRFVADNGRTIADSAESYWNRADALHGINIIKGAFNAPVR